MQKRLLLTLPCENGELYSTTNSRRIKLADCKPEIEIYEVSSNVPILGRSCGVKKYQAALVLCEDMDFTRSVDETFLRTVSGFELTADVQRKDGVFEVLHFSNLLPSDIELGGTWTFEIQASPEQIRKLLAL